MEGSTGTIGKSIRVDQDQTGGPMPLAKCALSPQGMAVRRQSPRRAASGNLEHGLAFAL